MGVYSAAEITWGGAASFARTFKRSACTQNHRDTWKRVHKLSEDEPPLALVDDHVVHGFGQLAGGTHRHTGSDAPTMQ